MIRTFRPHPIPFFAGRAVRAAGRPARPSPVEYSQQVSQAYRVADDSLDRYELYLGEDGPPDFDASGQPVATSPTLPFTHSVTPPGAGTKELQMIICKRNKFSLLSFNRYIQKLSIDTSGDEILGLLNGPEKTWILDTDELGYIQIMAKYIPTERHPGDKWEIYAGNTTPVPGVDTPVYSADMVFSGGNSIVNQQIGPFTGTVKAYVVVLRSDDDERALSDLLEIEIQSPPNMGDLDIQ